MKDNCDSDCEGDSTIILDPSSAGESDCLVDYSLDDPGQPRLRPREPSIEDMDTSTAQPPPLFPNGFIDPPKERSRPLKIIPLNPLADTSTFNQFIESYSTERLFMKPHLDHSFEDAWAYLRMMTDLAYNVVSWKGTKTMTTDQRRVLKDSITSVKVFLRGYNPLEKVKEMLPPPPSTNMLAEEIKQSNHQILHEIREIKNEQEKNHRIQQLQNTQNQALISQMQAITDSLKTTQQTISDLAESTASMQAKVNEINERPKSTYASITSQPSFIPSSVNTHPSSHPRNFIAPTRKTFPVIITSKLATDHNIQVKEKYIAEKYCLKAKFEQIGPIRYAGQHAIKIEAPTENQRTRLIEVINAANVLSARAETLLNPYIKIKFVPNSIPVESLISDFILIQNEKLNRVNATAEDFKYKLKLANNRVNAHRDDYTAVFEVTPKISAALLADPYVYVNHLRCPVEKHINFKHCLKCSNYGHTISKCNSTSQLCGFCNGTDHAFLDCPRRKSPTPEAKCPKCTESNARHSTRLDTNHSAYDDQKCSLLAKAKEKMHANVNWGL